MKVPWARVALAALACAVLFVLAALLAPELNAGAAREPLRRALSQSTGRAVELGEVRYQAFPFLGVAATDVVIPEDPRFGLEPVAYVGELQAGLHWPSLLAGKIRLGSVRLVEASINVARTTNAGWNLPALLQAMMSRGGAPAPRVEIRAGRINFRDGTLKSPFFLNEVDLDLESGAGGPGSLAWSYEASPARTDRSESGFGRFKGRGAWDPSSGPDGRLEIDLELERSLAGEVLTLVTGRDLGIQGRLSTRAQLDGPIGNVRIKGSLRVESPGDQGFFGFRGAGWTLPYEGRLDLIGQDFTVGTAPPREGENLPLELRASCRRLLSRPHWSAAFGFDGLAAPVLMDLARRFGARAPEGLSLEGAVHGLIEYTQDAPVRGRVELRNAAVTLRDAGPLTFDQAAVAVEGSEIRLEPAVTRTPGGDLVELSGRWEVESETAEFRLKTQSMPLPALRAALNQLVNVPAVSALAPCATGELKGELRFERRPSSLDRPAAWFGDLELNRARCAVQGAPDLAIDRAQISLRGLDWSARKAQGTWGAWPFRADLDFHASAPRAYRVDLALQRVDGEQLDRFFRPTLRRSMGFIERAFRSRTSPPAWLSARRVEGSLRIDSLALAGLDAAGLEARFFWDGLRLEIPDLTAAVEGGRFSGRHLLLLGGETVRNRLDGRVDGLEFGQALIESEFSASWAGFGQQLMETLEAEAQVTARTPEFADQPLKSIQACVSYDARKARDRLQISCLEAFAPNETFAGMASRQDSKWVFDFSGPKRQFRLTGSLSPAEWTLETRPR